MKIREDRLCCSRGSTRDSFIHDSSYKNRIACNNDKNEREMRSFSARNTRGSSFGNGFLDLDSRPSSDYLCYHDNMLWQKINGRSTSPRPTSRRSKSSREIYHPAIKDLSEQAGLNSQSFCADEDFHAASPPYLNGFADIPVATSQECNSINEELMLIQQEPVRLSTASPFCNTNKLPTLYENSYSSYRQRVVMSGIRLKLLSSNRRPLSTEPPGIVAPSIPYSYPSEPSSNVSFIIKNTNSQKEDTDVDVAEKRKIPHYSAKTRLKSHSGTLLSDGKQVHMNVCHQHLVHVHPIERHRTSLWLSNGFKVQSFKSKNTVKRPQTTIKPSTSEGYFKNIRKSAQGKLCRDFTNLNIQNNVKSEMERQKDLEMIISESLKPTDDEGEAKTSPLKIQGGLTGPNRLAADFNLQKG